jgi:hypothetical protein
MHRLVSSTQPWDVSWVVGKVHAVGLWVPHSNGMCREWSGRFMLWSCTMEFCSVIVDGSLWTRWCALCDAYVVTCDSTFLCSPYLLPFLLKFILCFSPAIPRLLLANRDILLAICNRQLRQQRRGLRAEGARGLRDLRILQITNAWSGVPVSNRVPIRERA